jgi:hypothetical protein
LLLFFYLFVCLLLLLLLLLLFFKEKKQTKTYFIRNLKTLQDELHFCNCHTINFACAYQDYFYLLIPTNFLGHF